MPKVLEEKRLRVEFRLSPEVDRMIRLFAAKDDLDKSDVIETLVRVHIGAHVVIPASSLSA